MTITYGLTNVMAEVLMSKYADPTGCVSTSTYLEWKSALEVD